MRVPRAPFRLAAVAIMAGGCLTTQDVLVDRPWTLVQVAGVPPVGDAGVAFGADGRFSIRTGCNTGGGTYHLDGNRILLDSEQLTAQPCDEPLATQESAVLRAVEGRPTYAIDTGTGRLRLVAEDGTTLLFEAP